MIREFSLNEVWLLILAARWTVVLSAMAFVGGGVGGFVVAVARVSPYRPVATLAAAFIKVVQGTPLLMQLYLVYFGASLLRPHQRRVDGGGAGPHPLRQRLPRRDLARLYPGRSPRAVGGGARARAGLYPPSYVR